MTIIKDAIEHEVMEPYISGDDIRYSEKSVVTNQYRCNGCGLVWAIRWHAEKCEERGHKPRFVQRYPYRPEGFSTPSSANFGVLQYNEYTRRAIRRDPVTSQGR